jgi:hypothetical protein
VFHTELILSSLRSSDSLTDAESESETSSDDDAQAKERKCRGPSQKTGTASWSHCLFFHTSKIAAECLENIIWLLLLYFEARCICVIFIIALLVLVKFAIHLDACNFISNANNIGKIVIFPELLFYLHFVQVGLVGCGHSLVIVIHSAFNKYCTIRFM